MTRNNVDLPQPDGPMSDTNSPRRIERSMPDSAVVTTTPSRANVLSTPAMRTTVSLPAADALPADWVIEAPRRKSSQFGHRRAASQDEHLEHADEREERDPEQG